MNKLKNAIREAGVQSAFSTNVKDFTDNIRSVMDAPLVSDEDIAKVYQAMLMHYGPNADQLKRMVRMDYDAGAKDRARNY